MMDDVTLDPALGLGSAEQDHDGEQLLALAQQQHHHHVLPPSAELHLPATSAHDSSQYAHEQHQTLHPQHQQQEGSLGEHEDGGSGELDAGVVGADTFHLFNPHASYQEQHHLLHHVAPADHQAALDALPDPPSASATLVDLAGVDQTLGDGAGSSTAAAASTSRGPRPPTIPIACARCRKQKLKCSGGRPCERCSKKGLAADEPGGCEYVAEIRRRGLGKKNRKSGDGGQQQSGGEDTGDRMGVSSLSVNDSSTATQYAGADGHSGGSQAGDHHPSQQAWHEAYASAPGATGSDAHPSFGLHEAEHHHNGDVLAAHANAEAGPSNYGPPADYPHSDHDPELHQQLHAHRSQASAIDPALRNDAGPGAPSEASHPSGSAAPIGGNDSTGRPPLPSTGGSSGDALGFSPTSIQAMDLLDFAGLNSDELSLLSHAATRMPDLPAPPTPSSSSAVFSSQLSGDRPTTTATEAPFSSGSPTHCPSGGSGGGQASLSTTVNPTGDVKPPVPPKTPIACARCRTHKLRCPTPPPGPCERCIKAGVGGECAYAEQIRRRGESKRKRGETTTGIDLLIGPSAEGGAKRIRTEEQGVQDPVDDVASSIYAEAEGTSASSSHGEGHGYSVDRSIDADDAAAPLIKTEFSGSHVERTHESALRDLQVDADH